MIVHANKAQRPSLYYYMRTKVAGADGWLIPIGSGCFATSTPLRGVVAIANPLCSEGTISPLFSLKQPGGHQSARRRDRRRWRRRHRQGRRWSRSWRYRHGYRRGGRVLIRPPQRLSAGIHHWRPSAWRQPLQLCELPAPSPSSRRSLPRLCLRTTANRHTPAAPGWVTGRPLR